MRVNKLVRLKIPYKTSKLTREDVDHFSAAQVIIVRVFLFVVVVVVVVFFNHIVLFSGAL